YVFFLLLSSHVLGALWRAEAARAGRLLSLLVLAAFLAGNAAHVRGFVQAGRGEFREALAWVVQEDPTPTIAVTGDLDFRVRKYVTFYARLLGDSRAVLYR